MSPPLARADRAAVVFDQLSVCLRLFSPEVFTFKILPDRIDATAALSIAAPQVIC